MTKANEMVISFICSTHIVAMNETRIDLFFTDIFYTLSPFASQDRKFTRQVFPSNAHLAMLPGTTSLCAQIPEVYLFKGPRFRVSIYDF